MGELRDNFDKWHKATLQSLYGNRDAGFAIVTITLPLLERYLRELSGENENPSLGRPFYNKLIEILKPLGDVETARKFWKIFRHGLLHQGTLKKDIGDPPKKGIFSYGIPEALQVESEAFILHPVLFARQVISIIEGDFETFEAINSPNHGLPVVRLLSEITISATGMSGTGDVEPYGEIPDGKKGTSYLGTASE